MKISRLKLVIFLSTLPFLILLSIISFLIFFNSREVPEESSKSTKSKTYKYQEFLPSNDIRIGIVTLNSELLEGEFYRYPSPDGDQVIISNHAFSQFKCEGSCSCPSEKESSGALSALISFVTFAPSVRLALKIAENKFHKECRLHFSFLNEISSSCDEQNIESSVSSCSEKEVEPSSNEEEGKEFAEYSCEGYCITNKLLRSPDGLAAQKEYEEETGGCEKLTLERKISLEEGKTNGLKRVRETFTADLSSFCRSVSKKSYWSVRPKSYTHYVSSMCTAGDPSNDFYEDKNVKCKVQDVEDEE